MPILDRDTLDLISHSAAQTRRFGAYLGQLLRAGDVVCLAGDLGTGKTRLVQGIGQGMGIAGTITSPTYTLIAEYRPAPPGPALYHVDVYRLDAPAEQVLDLGIDDYLEGAGVCVIEWADRIRAVLPEDCLWIELRHLDESKRGILIRSSGEHYRTLLRQFRESAFGV